MEIFAKLNYLAIILSTVIYFGLGFLWYRRETFGLIFLKEKGIDIKKRPPKMTLSATIIQFGGVIVTLLLYTIGIAAVMNLAAITGTGGGIIIGLLAIIFVIIPMNANNLFFPPKPKLFLIDVGFQSVGTLIASIILSIWR